MIDLDIAGSVERWFARGETIVDQGEPSSSLYVVRDGLVKLTAVSPDGREAAVDLLGAGDFFGEHCLFEAGTSPRRALALTSCSVIVVAREALRASVQRRPGLALALVRGIAARLDRACENLENAMLNDAPTRLSRHLALLARHHGRRVEGGLLLEPGLTQQDLAQMVGSSRETVNKAIAWFVARGLIRMEGRRYLIPDTGALERLRSPEPGELRGNGWRRASV